MFLQENKNTNFTRRIIKNTLTRKIIENKLRHEQTCHMLKIALKCGWLRHCILDPLVGESVSL